MSDLISRQAAIDAILAIDDHGNSDRANALGLAEFAITVLPSAEPHSINLNQGQSSDMISRQAAIDALEEDAKRASKQANYEIVKDLLEATYKVCEAIVEELPSADPQERKTGKWISADAVFGGVPFYCSECGENTLDTVMGKPRWNYCPNCGCKMEVDNEQND